MRIKSTLAVLGIALASAFALPASVSAQTAPGATTSSTCDGSDAYCAALASLTDLQATVAELVPDLRLAFSLNVKVQAATNSFLGGQYEAALGQLYALVNQVNAAGQSRQLDDKTTTTVSNKAKTSEINITKATDVSSPKLF